MSESMYESHYYFLFSVLTLSEVLFPPTSVQGMLFQGSMFLFLLVSYILFLPSHLFFRRVVIKTEKAKAIEVVEPIKCILSSCALI